MEKTFYVLAVVDMHSKYVAAQVLQNVKSADVVKFLQTLFMTFGFCMKLTTHNRVQFTSSLFVDFLRSHGISHIRSSVYNPQANGQIERVNKNLKKVLENAKLQQISFVDMPSYLLKYLFSYNNTKHDTLDECPANMLLKFVPRTYINPSPKNDPGNEEYLTSKKEEIQRKVEKRADYANDRRKPVTSPDFQVGDWVQKPPGPIRRIVAKIGPYSYKLNDGYTVNARLLRRIKRPSDQVHVPVTQDAQVTPRSDRYLKRQSHEPDRYIFS